MEYHYTKLSVADGAVYVEEGNSLSPLCNTGGSPAGACVDHLGNTYVFDQAHAAILLVSAGGPHTALITEYEGKQLLGPHSGVFDSQGQLFFTDPGPFGETGIDRARGSVYVITGQGGNKMLRPILQEAAAQPTGIAINAEDSCLYVAELSNNRLLRAVQRPANVWHFSVFHQFAGKLGPSSVVCDAGRGLIYVARTDLKEVSTAGVVSVLNAEGELLKDITLPGYPELTGLCLSPDNSALVVVAHDTVLRLPL